MYNLFQGFVKATGYIPSLFYFKKKIYFEDESIQNRKIKGKALVVSNHFSVFDYALILFTFPFRSIKALVAEVLYKKNFLFSFFLKAMGCIKVERDKYDFKFLDKTVAKLNKNKVCLVFPESRLPTKDERLQNKFLDFKPSYVYIALESGAPIIPIYTNGIYGKKMKKSKDVTRIIIGKPIYVNELYDSTKSEKENIKFINDYCKNYIYSLKTKLEILKKEELNEKN